MASEASADVLAFSAGPPLPTATAQTVAITGDDGMVYLFGGFNQLSAAYRFDPTAGTYTALAAIPTQVRGACGALATDGRIVLIGGYDDGVGEVDAVQIYDPVANTWAAGTSTPSGWECAAVAGADGRVHLLGGESDSTTHRSYDVLTDTWMDHADLPSARVAHGAGVGLDGRIYVFGGDFSGGGPTSMDVWDPATNTYATGSALPSSSVQSAFATSGQYVFALGGSTSSGNNGSPFFSAVLVLDTMTGLWSTETATLSTGIREANAAVAGGAVHVFGGSTGAPTVTHQLALLDSDDDTIADNVDNCVFVDNVGQANADADAFGDACDVCPNDAADDVDGDTVCGNSDNCPDDANTNQANLDGDSLGDACDTCPNDAANDADGDSICANADNCPTVANPGQEDADNDGTGDACEVAPTGGGGMGGAGGDPSGGAGPGGSAEGGGGSSSNGGSSSGGSSAGGGASDDGTDGGDDGCGCKVVGQDRAPSELPWVMALGAVLALSRRRRLG